MVAGRAYQAMAGGGGKQAIVISGESGAVAANERSFHAFYALTAARKHHTLEASHYAYLRQSGCYTANGVDDLKYFGEINKSMEEIGFSKH
ncbi:unnamed protein product [Sphagnum balticum]